MKPKTDRELLLETHRDVQWIKENGEKLADRVKEVELETRSLSRKINYGFGFMAAMAIIWEKFFKG